MKKNYIAAIAAAMTLVSCVQDVDKEIVPEHQGTKTFEAAFGVAASKAVLKPGADESRVEWSKDDLVSVFAGEQNYLYVAQSGGATTILVTDAADVPSEGTYYGLFPYDADASVSEGVVTTELPASQTAVEGSFSTHLAVSQTTSDTFSFRNVCGLVKVNVSSDNVTSIVFEGNSGEIVAGGINVTVGDAPAWAVVEGAGETAVTLLPAEGQDVIAAGDYYFAVLPQTFAAGFKVTSHKNDGYSVVRNVTSEVEVVRSGMVAGKSFGISGKGTEEEPYILITAQDMVDMRTLAKLDATTYFRMDGDIDMASVKNWTPVNYDQDYTRQIHFDGNGKTITNFAPESFVADDGVEAAAYPSLFGVLYGSCRNLTIRDSRISVSETTPSCGFLGGYVGTKNKNAEVENVKIYNAEVYGGSCVGGFGGQSNGEVTFKGCYVEARITAAGTDAGGMLGKLSGTAEFGNCETKVEIISTASSKNRVGGFIGWNSSAKTTITDCHVLEGTVLTDQSGRTSSNNGNYGGFIGFGDTSNTELKISGCSATAVIDAGISTYNSCFIGGTGYASTTEITDSWSAGSVVGGNYTGGFFGAVQNTVTISRCWSSANVTSSGQRVGGLVGTTTKPITITDSYSTGDVTADGQQVGGILGYSAQVSVITDCYATGDVTSKTAGAAGIIGTLQVEGSAVSGCIAWNGNIVCNRADNTKWAPGAIIGAVQTGNYSGCYRRADMVLTDAPEAMALVDQEDVENGLPAAPSYSEETTQRAYHGKAAAEGATVSSVAKSLGWDESVWDLSGDTPVLK